MPKTRQIMAKEIVEQVQMNFKKQQINVAEKQPPTNKAERNYEDKYEPSPNFHNVLSGIMGESQAEKKRIETNENANPDEASRKAENQNKVTEQTTQSPNEKTGIPQAPEITKKPQQEEDTSKPPKASIFERLSKRENAEEVNHEQKEETAQVSNTAVNQEEKDASKSSISIFERLSRNVPTD